MSSRRFIRVISVLTLVAATPYAFPDSQLQRPSVEILASRSELTARVTIRAAETIGSFGEEACGIVHTATVYVEGKQPPHQQESIKFLSFEGYRVGSEYLLFLTDSLPFSEKMIELLDDEEEIIPEIRECQRLLEHSGIRYAPISMKSQFEIVDSSVDPSRRWVHFDPTTVTVSDDRFDVKVERISDCLDDADSCVLLRQRSLVSLESISRLMIDE